MHLYKCLPSILEISLRRFRVLQYLFTKMIKKLKHIRIIYGILKNHNMPNLSLRQNLRVLNPSTWKLLIAYYQHYQCDFLQACIHSFKGVTFMCFETNLFSWTYIVCKVGLLVERDCPDKFEYMNFNRTEIQLLM